MTKNTTQQKTMTTMIAEATTDAYSFSTYGAQQWQRAADLLERQGLSAGEIEWVLRSKWMRWAADEQGHPYGHSTAAALNKRLATIVRDARRYAQDTEAGVE